MENTVCITQDNIVEDEAKAEPNLLIELSSEIKDVHDPQIIDFLHKLVGVGKIETVNDKFFIVKKVRFFTDFPLIVGYKSRPNGAEIHLKTGMSQYGDTIDDSRTVLIEDFLSKVERLIDAGQRGKIEEMMDVMQFMIEIMLIKSDNKERCKEKLLVLWDKLKGV